MNARTKRYLYRRAYAGPILAVVFDWAGTTVDHGSLAPVAAFREVFRRRGVAVSDGEIRGPMGTAKKDHIQTMLADPAVRERWEAANGSASSKGDVDAMYEEFLPLEVESAALYARLIPGTLATVEASRERGIKVGSSSGYAREIMARILPVAREQGYEPDVLVCPEDVPAGRPHPWMMYENAMKLGVYPMAACVKVGDTVTDIEEGLNAGAWTVGLARTGNELGLSEEETAALEPEDLAARLEGIHGRMHRYGAHYVVGSIAEVPEVLEEIEARLQAGDGP